jgi:hypothetical protein
VLTKNAIDLCLVVAVGRVLLEPSDNVNVQPGCHRSFDRFVKRCRFAHDAHSAYSPFRPAQPPRRAGRLLASNSSAPPLSQAFAGLPQRLQLVEPATLNPDEIVALCGPLRLIAYGAEGERRLDRVKRGGRDGDADQPRELALGLVLSTLGQRDTH